VSGYSAAPGLRRWDIGRTTKETAVDAFAARPATWARVAPLAAAALAAALFIGMDAMVKTLAGRFDALQLTFLRFASGSVYALALWAWFRTPMPPRGSWPLHGLRSVLLLAALVAWFHSLKLLPLVQAVAVGYTAPIFISLLAMLVLGERPGRWIWVALVLGMLGCAVGLWPELSAQTDASSAARVEGQLAALMSAVCYAGVVVLARHQAQRDALWTILLVQNLLPMALLAGPMAWAWPPMALADLGPVLLIGLLATGGLMCITWAFTHVEASRAAPLEYTGLVWAAGLGWLLFGELPTAWSLGSAALIVAGALLLLRR
jgi:S-adenosylmethionine uptake transporter